MKVKELLERDEFKEVCVTDGEREICGAYSGDLLSWVMGRAKPDNAWITIMSNMNIVAVASLIDFSCIILSENVSLEADVLKTAEAKDINIISTELPAYETALLLGELLK